MKLQHRTVMIGLKLEDNTGGIFVLSPDQVKQLLIVWQSVMVVASIIILINRLGREFMAIIDDVIMAVHETFLFAASIVSIATRSIAWGLL